MIRIIFVADDPKSAQEIQSRLQRVSYDVIAVTAGTDEVIKNVDELRPDVILMDVRLKGEMHGVNVARKIKRLHDIPIIFITADAEEAAIRRAIAAEPDGFLIKPLNELELVAAIDLATRRYQKERQARENVRRLHELADMLPVVVYEVDETARFTFVNAASFDMFGYTKEELEAGMSLFQLIAPADRERAETEFRRRMSEEDVGQLDYTGLRKDGSVFPISVRGAPIRRDGAVIAVRGVAVDVTELKHTKEELYVAARFASENPYPVLRVGGDGALLYANEAGSTVLEEYLHKTGEPMLPLLRDAATDALTANAVRQIEVDVADHTFEFSVAPIVERQYVNFYGVDIAARKHAEESAREHAHTIEILNQIVTEGNRTTDVQSFAETATKLTCELMHFDIGSIYLIDMDAHYTTLRYAQGIPETARYAIEKIPRHQAPYDTILIDGAPLFAEDYVTFLPRDAPSGIASLASVPLYSQNTIIGALSVGSATRHAFSQAEQELLIAIGYEVGTVIAKLQSEESLRQHAQIVDLAKDSIIIRDLEDRITYWNKGAEQLYGWSAAEAKGQKLHTLIRKTHPEERDGTDRSLFATGRSIAELTDTTKDGEPITVNSRQTLYKDAAREPTAILEMDTDITERKFAERALAWESAIVSTIARLAALVAPTSTFEDIALAVLDATKLLTESESGFVGLIDLADRDMIAFGLTQMMAEGCAIPEEKRRIRFPIGPDGSYPGLWGHALTTKRGFYTNAPATHPASQGTPDGHTPLAQLLAAPALVGEDVIGQVVVANPGRDYTERDLRAVERLADVYALAVVRTREEQTIRATLEERETLLKEIHHRVKNNMQIVSSLLSLQAAQATERETIEMLDESQSRIRSMALIHEKLYRSGSLAEIDVADYVESLTDDLLRMYNVALGVITITTDIESVKLGVDIAIPCALIINELVSNSLKHAFPDGRTGDVTVALQRENGTHTLTVADDGVGFPPDLDFRATDSLGMQLVATLVNQLDGTITLDRTKGTTFIITFKPEGARVSESGGE